MLVHTVDFETYYSKEYSLSRMSTADYVSDPQFQIIMVGVKKNDEKTEVLSYRTVEDYRNALLERGVGKGAILCHNTMFDGLILEEVLDIRPVLWLDTMGMAQAIIKPFNRSVSLSSCLKYAEAPISKGTYVSDALGKRLEDFTPAELIQYAKYCRDDTDGEWWLFNWLKKRLPKDEFIIIDETLRMYLEPKLELLPHVLEGVLREEEERTEKLLKALPDWVEPAQLSSNPKFAKLLKDLNVDPPVKISPTTNKITWAFSKDDPGFKDMEDEYADDPVVSAVLLARKGTKSTLASSRAQRMLDIANKYDKFRVPLRYYAAHTGRFGGMEKINCQNPPRIKLDKDGNPKTPYQIRLAMAAPKGSRVVVADLAQIEARINAWLSGQKELLEIFRTGGDPYAAFASKVWHKEITKEGNPLERFIGKTCILGLGYGMGWVKLRATLRKDDVRVTQDQSKDYVYTYRDAYREIPELWDHCDFIIKEMAGGGICPIGPCMATKDRITLPNGMGLVYDNLRHVSNVKYKGYVYTWGGTSRTMWGGKFVENLCQSLARIILMGHMLEIRKRLGVRACLNVHDELVFVVAKREAEAFLKAVLEIMHTGPDWAEGLPIAAEGGIGRVYGECK